ncbi:MAG: glucans biosynthesis glucosyltransferase MdoH, partial [Rhodobacteraceae bacterium]|nr:glucans biosynthesis glucosyltransferase MdoH [Paracoccaceae bacterium]
AGLSGQCAVFVLSDTAGRDERLLERRLFAGLEGVSYRNRLQNAGRKPGNIAEWIDREGAHFETMAVLDADSRMSAARLAQLLARMDAEPRLGLLQSGIRLVPGRSRLARLQRLSARLTGPGFVHGFARWTGDAGNYWGHNALIRVAAFADHARLPRLSGRPPFGGDLLSHDFVEAAWLRRAGWLVEVAPESRGSFEEAPETMGELHRRDRRWAQGNLQHLRVIGARGLHPVSRLHFASGLQSYLSAPLWLGLVALFASGAVRPGALAGLTVLLVAAALLVPKLAGLAFWHARLGPRHDRARRLLRRAALGELALSSALAPLMMWRQSLAVAAVLAGQDCGWKRAGPRRRPLLPGGVGEAMVGVGLLTLAGLGAAGGGALAVVIVLPVAGPLLAAPLLTRWFDAEPAPALPVEARAMALGKA